MTSDLQKAAALRDQQIVELKSQLVNGEVAGKLAFAEAVSSVEKKNLSTQFSNDWA